MGEFYIEKSPYQSTLFPKTHEVLAILKKDYHLHIITNGFKEVQHIKIKYSQIDQYFDSILCSDEVGVNKPNPLVFKTALERSNALPEASVMIGDDFSADVVGAENVGMKGILFDAKGKYKHRKDVLSVHTLSEIPETITQL